MITTAAQPVLLSFAADSAGDHLLPAKEDFFSRGVTDLPFQGFTLY